MSWRKAGDLARYWATLARRQGDELPAQDAWIQRRIALEFEAFASECMRRSAIEDVTVVDTKRT